MYIDDEVTVRMPLTSVTFCRHCTDVFKLNGIKLDTKLDDTKLKVKSRSCGNENPFTCMCDMESIAIVMKKYILMSRLQV